MHTYIHNNNTNNNNNNNNKAGCTTPPDEFTAHTVAIFNSLAPLHTPSQWNLCRLQPFVKKTYPPGLKTTNLTSCSSLLPLPTVLACSRSHPATLRPGCRSSQLGASTCTWTQPSSRWPSNGGWASTRHHTFGALIALTTS